MGARAAPPASLSFAVIVIDQLQQKINDPFVPTESRKNFEGVFHQALNTAAAFSDRYWPLRIVVPCSPGEKGKNASVDGICGE
jgi:hypothetical protein